MVQPIDNNIATHVVTAVVYGADAFLVFDSTVSQSDDHTEVHGSMKATVEKLSAIADIKGHAEIDLDDSERENVANFTANFMVMSNYNRIPATLKRQWKHTKTFHAL